MRRRRSERIWADGTTWESQAAYQQAQQLAVEITGQEVQLIDQLVRYCEQAHRRGRPDIYYHNSAEQRQRLVRGLYERAGAATALAGAQTVPFTVAEIGEIEQIRRDIEYYAGYYLFGSQHDPMVDRADDLLNQLHFRVGHARATADAGGIAVFPEHLQLPASWA